MSEPEYRVYALRYAMRDASMVGLALGMQPVKQEQMA